jgi:peroxiredoxin Q/BCP
MRSPLLGLLAGFAAIVALASYFGHYLYEPGAYRSMPWAHLAAVPVLAAAAIWLKRKGKGERWPRRVAAWVGVIAACAAAGTLWLFVFLGSRLPEQAPPPLGVVPDFALPDQDGDVVRLADLRARGPVVVTFYRGSFDRWGRAALHDLKRIRARIEQAGGRVVAISGDPSEDSAGVRASLGLEFPILADVELATTRGFGVVEEGGRAPRPSTFVIDRAGRARWLFFPGSLREFADLDEIVRRVEEAAR